MVTGRIDGGISIAPRGPAPTPTDAAAGHRVTAHHPARPAGRDRLTTAVVWRMSNHHDGWPATSAPTPAATAVPRLLYITGLPRAGSTLLCQLLGLQ